MNKLNFSANIPETQAISQSQNERHATTDPNVQTLNVTTIKPSSCASDNVQLYLQFFEYTHMVYMYTRNHIPLQFLIMLLLNWPLFDSQSMSCRMRRKNYRDCCSRSICRLNAPYVGQPETSKLCLQCSDTVGLITGKASSLKKI